MSCLRYRSVALVLTVFILSTASAQAHAPSIGPSVRPPVMPRIDVPRTRIDVPRPEIRVTPSMGNSNPSTGNNATSAHPPEGFTPAATDNLVGPIIQNVIAAGIVPQSAFVPGPAIWQPTGGTATSLSGSGAIQVVGMVVANALINNINHYVPADLALSQGSQNAVSITANGLVAGGLTLATAAASPVAVPTAMIAAGSAAIGTGASIWIESTFTDNAVGHPTVATGIRATLNGVTAGGLAAGGATLGAVVAGTALAVPATTIAAAVGVATATVYVARPVIDAAATSFFDGAVGVVDAVFGAPVGYQ